MAKSTTEIFNDKVSLIYEYDKQSPLFVRVANTEIENNNVEEAISILNSGLEIYPSYAAAYLLLSKAQTLIGNYSAALKAAKTGSDLINSKKTYDYYLREIETIKKQRSLFEVTKRNVFFGSEEKNESSSSPDLFTSKDFSSQSFNDDISSIDDRLSEIAKEISSAKIAEVSSSDEKKNSPFGFSDKSIIVSDTLAKIYSAQGEYKEAIEVYNKLINKFPAKKEYYSQKINELKEKLK